MARGVKEYRSAWTLNVFWVFFVHLDQKGMALFRSGLIFSFRLELFKF